MNTKANWTHGIPTETGICGHKILRCPPIRMRPFVIISDNVKAVGIHWISRRSIPCSGIEQCENCKATQTETGKPKTCPNCEQCPHCLKQKPTWKGYLGVWNPENGARSVLEITPPTFESTGAYRKLYTTLRGATITLTRKGSDKNGRLMAELNPSGIAPAQLPDDIDVIATMEEAWAQPNKSERRQTTEPRDEIGGRSAAEETLKRLQKAGLIDEHGQQIDRPKTTTATDDTAAAKAADKPIPKVKTLEDATAEKEKQAAFKATIDRRRHTNRIKDLEAKTPKISAAYSTTEEQRLMLNNHKRNGHQPETR